MFIPCGPEIFFFVCVKKGHLNSFNYLPASVLIVPKQMALTLSYMFMLLIFLKLCSYSSNSDGLAFFLSNCIKEKVKDCMSTEGVFFAVKLNYRQ